MQTTGINVHQKPISMRWSCNKCFHDNEISYSDFEAEHGEYCNWMGSIVQCEECGEPHIIDDIDW